MVASGQFFPTYSEHQTWRKFPVHPGLPQSGL